MGRKVEGLMKFIEGEGAHLVFKTDDHAPEEKVHTNTCVEFVLDSSMHFVRLKRELRVDVGPRTRVIRDSYIRVFDEGKVGLYKFYLMRGMPILLGGTSVTEEEFVFVKKQGSDEFIQLHWRLKKRKEQLKVLFPDVPLLQTALTHEKWKETVRLVKEYNKAESL